MEVLLERRRGADGREEGVVAVRDGEKEGEMRRSIFGRAERCVILIPFMIFSGKVV